MQKQMEQTKASFEEYQKKFEEFRREPLTPLLGPPPETLADRLQRALERVVLHLGPNGGGLPGVQKGFTPLNSEKDERDKEGATTDVQRRDKAAGS